MNRYASSKTTDLYYSDQWQVLEEKVGSNVTKRYVWSSVYVDAMILRDRDTDSNGTPDERLWVQQDANWNVTALVDGSGNVVERYTYDPYGVRTVYDASYNVRTGGSAYDFQHGFQGMWYDATAGLNFTETRPYSPTLGRPIQVDILRFGAGDVNFYRWEWNNPTNGTDPSGLKVTRVSVAETARPHKGKWGGEFAWPVKFVINDKASKNGGLVIQHVTRVDDIGRVGVNQPLKGVSIEGLSGVPWDYYEAFYIEPGKKETQTYLLRTAVQMSVKFYKANKLDNSQNQFLKIWKKLLKDNVAVTNLEGTDWFISDGYPRTSGRSEYYGEVYYIDGMTVSDLSATWKKGCYQAGGLPAIDVKNVKANQKEIEDFFARHKNDMVGPAVHSIVLTWTGRAQSENHFGPRTPDNLK